MATIQEAKNQLITTNSKKTIRDYIIESTQELGKALPANFTNPERLVRIALTNYNLIPELANCTIKSYLGALFQAAQLGLEPGIDGQAYIIPFKNSKKINGTWIVQLEAQFIIGYKGYVTLFYRHSNSVSLDMHAVHEKDLFEYAYGTSAYLKHQPAYAQRGEVTHYYVIANLANGGQLFKVMSKEDCLQHGRDHSKCFNKETMTFEKFSPWAKEHDSMCKKTVLIQTMKTLPKSAEIQKAISMDETTKSIIKPDMLEVKDETNWNDNVIEMEDLNAEQLQKAV